ncbi:DUF2953 domain-containing protein [Falsibacillus albus]|uniref:DUF2953 domain-containing protein n=1 Tax=Falsibacillus albus TaxID=2478915 RepID=A0A3L7K650_9BACI|nr:DUF2953 domain-containing protein [Falsibacillus albus]
MFWIIVFILLFLILLIWLTPLNVYLDLYHGQDNDHFQILLKVWFGLIHYKIDIPMVRVDEDEPNIEIDQKVKTGKQDKTKKETKKKITPWDILNSLQDTKELIRHVFGMNVIIRKFLKKIKVFNLEWHSLIGTKDAALTGALVGGIWSAKSCIVALISKYMKLMDPPVVEVVPSFNMAISQISLKCMFKFRIGHAIFAGLKLIRYWKGGKAKFKTKPLSIFSEEKNKHSV